MMVEVTQDMCFDHPLQDASFFRSAISEVNAESSAGLSRSSPDVSGVKGNCPFDATATGLESPTNFISPAGKKGTVSAGPLCIMVNKEQNHKPITSTRQKERSAMRV